METLNIARGVTVYHSGRAVKFVRVAGQVMRTKQGGILLTEIGGYKRPVFELGRWRTVATGHKPTGQRLRLSGWELEQLERFFACRLAQREKPEAEGADGTGAGEEDGEHGSV